MLLRLAPNSRLKPSSVHGLHGIWDYRYTAPYLALFDILDYPKNSSMTNEVILRYTDS